MSQNQTHSQTHHKDKTHSLTHHHIKWEKLSNKNHFITLQFDGHSPNLVASDYITKTDNVHSKTSLKKVIIQRHHQ
jgi:hypothetical protein